MENIRKIIGRLKVQRSDYLFDLNRVTLCEENLGLRTWIANSCYNDMKDAIRETIRNAEVIIKKLEAVKPVGGKVVIKLDTSDQFIDLARVLGEIGIFDYDTVGENSIKLKVKKEN